MFEPSQEFLKMITFRVGDMAEQVVDPTLYKGYTASATNALTVYCG